MKPLQHKTPSYLVRRCSLDASPVGCRCHITVWSVCAVTLGGVFLEVFFLCRYLYFVVSLLSSLVFGLVPHCEQIHFNWPNFIPVFLVEFISVTWLRYFASTYRLLYLYTCGDACVWVRACVRAWYSETCRRNTVNVCNSWTLRNYLTFIGPWITLYFYSKTNHLQPMYQIYFIL